MRREDEARRLAEERRRKKAEMKAKRYEILGERTDRTERERWGTPKRAYNTWEARTQNTVDWANMYAEKLLRESEEMRSRYAQRHFRLYRKRDFLPRLLGDKIFTSGVVSPSDFSYGEGDGHFFPVLWEGREVILWKSLVNTDHRYDEEEIMPGIYVENAYKLTDILDRVFKPRIAAKQIREGKNHVFDCTKAFLEYGSTLRITPQHMYSFSCGYNHSETVEDDGTKIRFGDTRIHIPNPFYEENLIYAAMEHTVLQHSYFQLAHHVKP